VGSRQQSADIRLFSKQFANSTNAQLLVENPTLSNTTVYRRARTKTSVTPRNISQHTATAQQAGKDRRIACHLREHNNTTLYQLIHVWFATNGTRLYVSMNTPQDWELY